MKRFIGPLLGLGLFVSPPALAQQPPPLKPAAAPVKPATSPGADPRLAQPMIDALQALVKLREAELQALSQDMNWQLDQAKAADEAHQNTWAEWYAGRAGAGEGQAPLPDAAAPK